jgi:hypothetical protein
LPRLRWRDLWHVAASPLIAEGASVGRGSRLLGHASPAITLQTYAQGFATPKTTRPLERMEAAFGDVLAGILLQSDGGEQRPYARLLVAQRS